MKITAVEFQTMERFEGHFVGIAHWDEDHSVCLDVFNVYKENNNLFVVKESGIERHRGDLISSILYCAQWL